MSEANGNGTGTLVIPSDWIGIEMVTGADGEKVTFRLPLLETDRKLAEIRRRLIERKGSWDELHGLYAEHLKTLGAPELTLAQAETVADHLEVAAAEKKRRRAERLQSALRPLGSTT